MEKRFFLIGLALTFVVASCQRSDMQSLEAPVYELSVAASDFTSLDQAVSRATEKAFDAGDVIGLYVSQGSAAVGASGNHSSNVPYRYDEPAWRALRALGGELEAVNSYKTTAYYPYVHGLSDPTKVAHEVLADQSVVGSMERSDFMVSAPSSITGLSATPQNPKSTLLFTHSLAKLIVTMSVPEELEEAKVIALTEVKFRGLRLDCVVNVATGMVFNSATPVVGDVTPRLTSAAGTDKGAEVRYEAILPPQVIGAGSGVVWLRFATDQGDREMTYVIPADAGITLAANQKYILNLSSISDLAFVTEVDRNVLLDGLAHSEVELKIKSKKAWTLTSSNAWLRVKVAGGAYGNSVSGTGEKGEQTVYLDLAANTSATSSRAAVLSLESSSGSKVGYTVNQNYFNYSSTPGAWSPSAGVGAQALAPIDGNQVIRITSDEGAANGAASWLKFATSATFGQGDPKVEVDVVGSLSASTLWLQAGLNNTGVARSTTVRYTPVDLNGNLLTAQAKTHTVTQAAPTVTFSPVSWSPTGVAATQAVGVTTELGVLWKPTVASTGNWLSLTGGATGNQTGTGAAQSLTLAAALNPTNVARTGTLTASYGSVNSWSTFALSKAFTVTQAASTLTYNSPSATTPVAFAATSVNFTVTGTKGLTLSFTKTSGDAAFSTPAVHTCDGTAQTVMVTMAVNTGDAREAVYSATVTNAGASGLNLTGITVKQDGFATIPNPPTADQIVMVDGVKWTKGNLIAVNASNCKVGAPTDGGLFFHFGSLVGWTGGANGDGTGMGDPALAVQVKPVVYSGSTTWPAGHYTGGTAGTGYGLPADAPTTGIGDPCRFYLGAPWRTPTAAEWLYLIGASGANTNKGVPLTVNNTALSFPASGYRNASNGAFDRVGSYGTYWSSSVSKATAGYNLYFFSGNVNPQSSGARLDGMPVRCVSGTYVQPTVVNPPAASDYVTVDGLKWAKGNLVAKNSNECRVGAPTDFGLYFQFGSLIGYNNVAGAFDFSKHGAVWPAAMVGNPGKVWPAATAGTAHKWFFSGKGVTSGEINVTDPINGVGDPCALYLGSPWRMPTSAEYVALLGSVGEKTNKRLPLIVKGSNLAFPAAAYRNIPNGEIIVAANGDYWCGSVANNSEGHYVYFNSSANVSPQSFTSRAYGLSVRCVSPL